MKEHNKIELSPIIKWAGGKESELKQIIPNAPPMFDNYYEPFVGGGSVFVSIDANKYYINDKSCELVSLYKSIASNNKIFYNWISLIAVSWKTMKNFHNIKSEIVNKYIQYRSNEIHQTDFDRYLKNLVKKYNDKFKNVLDKKLIWERGLLLDQIERNLINKTHRMYSIEKKKSLLSDKDLFDNIDTAFMSALYMYYRYLYNNNNIIKNKDLATALFVFIRNYAYSGMFRYNNDGDFNVPYGGIAYNSKLLDKKIEYYKSSEIIELFKKTKIYCMDFEKFLDKTQPKYSDFIFLDPPYDSDFSTYSKNEFSREDQKRLANYMCKKCKAKWMMVIKNTPFIYSLYAKKGLKIKKFDKNYTVSFMNRNNKEAEHLLITNY